MNTLLAAFFLVVPPGSSERPLATRIDEVTVFPSTALVRRTAPVPAGGGRFVVSGLPWSMDADSVRARCDAAEIVGLDARERRVAEAPTERLEAARASVRELERELLGLRDEHEVLARVSAHLARLLELEEARHADELRAGRADVETWRANLRFFGAALARNRSALRESDRRISENEVRLADAKLELDRCSSGDGVAVRDVIVELADGAPAASIDLEYLVSGAGWKPRYDLRAATDAHTVELGYRADVFQATGEDWDDVSLALSTARPQLGAQAPELEPVWLYIQERASGGLVARSAAPAEESVRAELDDLGYSSDDEAEAWEAEIEDQGLSVRYRVASRESVPSRREPSTVLVGRATFDVSPEYFAAPALDTNVWLRGKTRNTSDWTLLPGVAAVYFGADFLGRAQIEAVQPGEEFVVHLGPDPALTIERTLLADRKEGPGIFGGNASRTQRYRIRLKNNGAAAARADGSALVFVREALPRSTDNRIGVKLVDPKPAVSTDERWDKEREEQSILTWALPVLRSGEVLVEYTTTITYPRGLEVTQ